MHNYKLTLAYDGTRYAGWQRQNHPASLKIQTIQDEVDAALCKVFKKRISVIGCGRTDSGVHAIGFVANFKTAEFIPEPSFKIALNCALPSDISVLDIKEVPNDFHARFDAKRKIYRYLISNNQVKTIFSNSRAWWIRYRLNVNLMRRESRVLLGKHNFKSFQAADRLKRCSVTTIRRIDIKKFKGCALYPFLKGENLVAIDIEGTGFLRNMARNIVGTLIEVGRGRIKKGGLLEILKRRDRRHVGSCAPAHGLYLLKVKY